MTGLVLKQETLAQLSEKVDKLGLTIEQPIHFLLQRFIDLENTEEWKSHEPDEETKLVLLQGEADFKSGK